MVFIFLKKESKNEIYVPIANSDPGLLIDGESIKFIVNRAEKPFKAQSYKFLGRWLSPSITERALKSKLHAAHCLVTWNLLRYQKSMDA